MPVLSNPNSAEKGNKLFYDFCDDTSNTLTKSRWCFAIPPPPVPNRRPPEPGPWAASRGCCSPTPPRGDGQGQPPRTHRSPAEERGLPTRIQPWRARAGPPSVCSDRAAGQRSRLPRSARGEPGSGTPASPGGLR